MQERSFSRQDATAIIVGFGLVVAVVAFFAVKGMAPEKDDAVLSDTMEKAALPSVKPEAAVAMARSSETRPIVDLRTEVEYQAAHILGSVSVPAEKIGEYAVTPGTELLVVPAKEESATEEAVRTLTGKGARPAVIEGGISGWEAGGGVVILFGNPSSPTDRSKVNFVSAEKFKTIVEDQRILHMILDVRNKGAFEKSHIPEAYNIPFAELEARRNEIPPAVNVALYADDDVEAFQASTRLFDMGVFSVKTLDIDFSEWETKGFPVMKK